MKQKMENLGTILSRNLQKKISGGNMMEDPGGDDSGSCAADTCKAKSTSSKSCTCSTTWDKCLCTTVY